MAKAKTGKEAAPAAEKKPEMRDVIDSVVGDDLEWPDEPAAADEPAPEPRKRQEAPPAAADDDFPAEEPLEEADDEPLTEQDKAINDLRKQISEKDKTIKSGEARRETERRAAARQSVEQNHAMWETAFDNNIREATQKLKELKAELAAAWDAGDNVTAADKQEAMTQETLRLNNAKTGKAQVAQNMEFLKANPTWAPENPAAPAAAAKADKDYTDGAKKWIEDHPRFNSDKKYKAACVALHTEFEQLQMDGEMASEQDSPEYFAFIEDGLRQRGMEKAHDEEAEEETAPAPQPRKRPQPQNIAAPGGNRSSGGAPRGGKLIGKLTPDQAWAAEQSDMSHKEYYETVIVPKQRKQNR